VDACREILREELRCREVHLADLLRTQACVRNQLGMPAPPPAAARPTSPMNIMPLPPAHASPPPPLSPASAWLKLDGLSVVPITSVTALNPPQVAGGGTDNEACFDGSFNTRCISSFSNENWISARVPQGAKVSLVAVYNQREGDMSQLGTVEIWLGSYPGASSESDAVRCGEFAYLAASEPAPYVVACPSGASGTHVTVKQVGPARPLALAEVEIYSDASIAPPQSPPSKPPPMPARLPPSPPTAQAPLPVSTPPTGPVAAPLPASRPRLPSPVPSPAPRSPPPSAPTGSSVDELTSGGGGGRTSWLLGVVIVVAVLTLGALLAALFLLLLVLKKGKLKLRKVNVPDVVNAADVSVTQAEATPAEEKADETPSKGTIALRV